MEGESDVTQSVIDELHSWDMQGNQMEGGSGLTRSIIEELHSWGIQGDQMEGENVLLELSLMNFILRIAKEIKW